MALFNSPDGGIHFKNPQQFQKSVALVGNILIVDSALASATCTSAGFFTQLAVTGFSDDTNWTANTYKTLLSITSGSGILSHLVGPTSIGATPTTTFEITVDGGIVYEIAVTATAATQRAILGPAQINTIFTTASEYLRGPSAINATRTVEVGGATYIPPWATMHLLGTPCLQFNSSLLVRAKSSENNSTTANQERQSGGQYRRFT